MIKEAIILAGGLGTRLRPVISDIPKCMAPVSGKPFLNFILLYLQENGIERFIFSVGYLHEMIEGYLKEEHSELNYTISLENEPLGTGGAIKHACPHASGENIFICNGDTLFKIDCRQVSKFHEERNVSCTLTLKPMNDFDRYGIVELDDNHFIRSFKEKQFYKSGLINGGVYALNVKEFFKEGLPERFSFEKDYLEKKAGLYSDNAQKLAGIIQNKYFVDIGIPEDYERAQVELLNC